MENPYSKALVLVSIMLMFFVPMMGQTTAPTSITGTAIICSGSSTTLTASGGTLDANAVNVWYRGGYGGDAYDNGWDATTAITESIQSTLNNNTNGILNLTSTGNDAQFYMRSLGSFDPSIYKYINVRYRVTAGTAYNMQVYFLTATTPNAVGDKYVASGALNSDGNWHTISIDMSSNSAWTTGGNITGWRFDWSVASGVTMDIDFIQFGTGIILDDAASITVSPTTNTTYYLNRKGPSVNTSRISQLVTVNALPTPTFTAQPGATACANTDVTYTTQSGQTNYVWTVPGTLNTDYTITSGGLGTSSNTITLKWLTAGSKTVTINYTNSNGCTAATATSSTATTVSGTPTTAAAGADQTSSATCGLTSVTLSGNTPTVGIGAWSIVSGTGGSVTTPSSPTSTFSGNAGSTYTLRWTISNSPCTSSTDEVVITFNQPSVAGSISGGGVSVVSGSNSTTLTLTGYTGSIQWQSSTTSSSTGFSDIGSATGATYTATNLNATTYYQAVVTNGVCTPATATSVTISILTAPSISYGVTGTQGYVTNAAITPLTLTNTGGTVSGVYRQVSDFAGSGTAGSSDGTGTGATFNGVRQIAINSSGDLFVADASNNRIRKITASGVVTTFAGSGVASSLDGQGTAATFRTPDGIAINAQGEIFVAEKGGNKIRKITASGAVSTFAGTGASGSSDNASGTSATFNSPWGLCFDASGNLFVADGGSGKVRKITPAGAVSTYGASQVYSAVRGMAFDNSGNLYVNCDNTPIIYKITPSETVSVFAGGVYGDIDGNGTSARTGSLGYMQLGSDNYIYFTDVDMGKVKKMSLSADVTTVVGGAILDGNGNSTTLVNPYGFVFDGLGNAFTTSWSGNKIKKISFLGYSISPSLPSGLSFNSTNGTISGTPTTTTAATTYTITAANAAGSNTTTVTFATGPTNTITRSSAAGTVAQTVCANTAITNITYNTTTATGATFSGLPTGVTGAWASNVVTISGTPTVAGSYSYTVTLTGGVGTVTSTGSITVSETPLIASQSTATQTVCQGSTAANFSVTATGSGTISYQWYSNTSASTVGATNLGSANGAQTATYTPQTTASGTKYYYCIVSIGSCSVTSSFSGAVVVNATSEAGTISGAGGTCFGTAKTLTLSGNTGTIQWQVSTTSSSSGFSDISGATASTYTVSDATAVGTYYYQAVVTNGVCSAATTATVVTVNVIAYPVVSAITGSDNLCLNASTTLSNATAGGVWSTTTPSIATINSTSGLVTGIASGSATLNYTVTNSIAGESNYGSVLLNGTNQSLSLNPGIGTIGTGAFTFECWFKLNSTPSNRSSILGTGTGNYLSINVNSLTEIETDAYGINRLGFTVPTMSVGTWYHLAVVRNSSGVETIFLNGVRSTTGAVTDSKNYNGPSKTIGHWQAGTYFPGNLASIRAVVGSSLYDPTQSTITVPSFPLSSVTNTKLLLLAQSSSTLLTDGSGVQTVTNNNTSTWTSSSPSGLSACPTTVTKTVTINPLPVVAQITGNTSICSSATSQLTSTTTGGVWSSATPNVATVDNTGLVTGVTVGSVTISYTFTDVNNCSNTVTTTVTVNALPTITTAGTAAAKCFSASAQTTSLVYTVTTQSSTSYSIDWDATANSAGLADQGSTSYTFIAGGGTLSTIAITGGTPAGTYNGTMTITNANGCTKTQAVTVEIYALPVIVSQSTSTQTLCQNDIAAAFTVTATGTGLTYQWFSNTTPSNGGGTSIALATNSSYTPPTSTAGTTYYYCVVTNSNGCTATSVVSGAVIVNAVPVVAGIAQAGAFGNALNFDGSNDYIESSVNPTSNFTIETWARPSGSLSSYHIIAAKWNSPEVFEVSITNAKARIIISTSTNFYDLSGSTTLSAGQWYHLAYTYDGSSIKVYVNGVIDGTLAVTGTIISNSQTLKIGATRGGVSYNFTGELDNFRVWSVARNASDILANVNYSLTSGTGLMASYDFNQGTAGGTNTGLTTLTDRTSNGNNGTLYNFALSGSTSNWVDGSNSSGGSSTPGAVCLNTTIQLSNTTTGGVWSTSDASIATVSSSGLVTGISVGSATISYTVTNASNCSTTATTSVTVNALPTPTFTSQAGSIVCVSTDVTYTTESGQSSYVWTVPGTLGTDYSITSGGIGSTSNTVTLKWLTSGSKTVTINYNNASGCSAASATSSTATTVRPIFTTGAIATTGETICYGGTPASTIGNGTAASGGDATITYSWRSSADGYTAAISGATSATYLPPAGLTTTTSYRRYAKDGTCNNTPNVSTGTWTVTVSQIPTTANAGPDQNVTASGGAISATLAGNTTIVGTGLWTIVSGTGGTITTPTSPTSTFSGTAGGTYILRWTISNSPCNASSDEMAITSTYYWTGLAGDDMWGTGNNWSTGTQPNAGAEIVISSGNPKMNADYSVGGSLTLSGTATLTVNPGKTLSIAAGGVANFGGKLVTFKSDATGTGQLGVVAGNLTGGSNVLVERHIPAGKRAFRFFGSPVTSLGTIKDNWMEGATPGVLTGYPYRTVSAYNPNLGYGTLITGAGGNANGFDASQTNNPSLFTFNNSTGAWVTVTNTTTGTISAGAAYRMFVRGDRSYGITASSEPPGGSTILRTTGTIATGQLTTGTHLPPLSQAASGWSLIGNPYQSVVDMSSADVVKNNMTDYYYIWDPRMGTRGAYVAYNYSVNTSSNGSSAVNRFVQPGQAFFVQNTTAGSNSIVFKEAAKGAVSNQTATFARNNTRAGAENGYTIDATAEKAQTAQTQAANFSSLSAILYYTDSLATGAAAADATRAIFGSQFSNIIDANDGRKFTNLDETMAIKQGTNLLSMELRSLPDSATKLPLNITQYVDKKYTMRLFWDEKLNTDTLVAYLRDRYTNKETEVKKTGNTDVEYILDADAKSSAADRFEIIFKRTSNQVTAVINYDNGQYIKIYPNPVQSILNIDFDLGQNRLVDIKVYDMTGRLVLERPGMRKGSGLTMSGLAKGTYSVKIWGSDGRLLMSEKIIKD